MKKSQNYCNKLLGNYASKPEPPASTIQPKPSHRTIGLKARTYRKATQLTSKTANNSVKLAVRKCEAAINSELNSRTVPVIVDTNKENRMILQNRQQIGNGSKKLPSVEVDGVQIKQYISSIVDKIKQIEMPKRQVQVMEKDRQLNLLDLLTNRSNQISNRILEPDIETIGLRSMKSEGGLLKIKRKRSTLRLYNPYN